jgi:hypothetical protein
LLRRREVAAAPRRRADEAWATIVDLVADTLDRSHAIARADVLAAFASTEAIGPRLVAARHLEAVPLVLVAEPVRVSIYTVSGAAALDLEENLAPVPGGVSASTWVAYLPTPAALEADVTAAAQTSTHLSVDKPPDGTIKAAADGRLLDLHALTRLLKEEER